jgi:hypothetical protein
MIQHSKKGGIAILKKVRSDRPFRELPNSPGSAVMAGNDYRESN